MRPHPIFAVFAVAIITWAVIYQLATYLVHLAR